MSRFFVYEEYAAKYETIASDVGATSKSFSTEVGFDKGIEVLSRTLESMNLHDDDSKKGLTFADLIIKVSVHHLEYFITIANFQAAYSTRLQIPAIVRRFVQIHSGFR